jgi:hypothetical protein
MKKMLTAGEKECLEELADALLQGTAGGCLLCGRTPAMGSVAWRPNNPYDRVVVRATQGQEPVVIVPLCPKCHFVPDAYERLAQAIRATFTVMS